MAQKWCEERSVESTIYHADWKNEGKSAGPKRNLRMLANEKEQLDAIVAFPGGKGTGHMVSMGEANNIKVIKIKPK